MTKIFAILVVICLMVSMFSINAFAADELPAPAEGTVLRVSALKNDGTTVKIKDYDNFEIGWNAAIDTALANNYERVIVDLYADWTADEDGEFGSDGGNGFDNETIYFPEGVKITLNMNDHTINRALDEWIYDGEVMYIEDDADVIINKGTITGGWSANGAGGIHVKDDVKLTLNDVHIVGNTADDADGGGISLESDSILTMNGGSFKNNRLIGSSHNDCGGALYVSGGTAIINNVEFTNNQTKFDNNDGSAIYVSSGELTLNSCTFEGNGLMSSTKSVAYSSVIYAKGSNVKVKDSTFGNHHISSIFKLYYATLNMESSVFTGAPDTQKFIDVVSGSDVYVIDSTFTDSRARVISGSPEDDSFFRNCTFNNTAWLGATFALSGDPVEFFDCNFGDTNHSSSYIHIINSSVSKGEARIGISGILEDGTTNFTDYYVDLVYGWNVAIGLAVSNVYDRVVVDLYADWTAVDGEFCNDGIGFSYDAIYFPENVKVTLNMNGHTIDRAMTTWQYNGEVICIDENADVIINGGKSGDAIINAKDAFKPAGVEMGTITGGWSSNGAGGIHIFDDAKVQLNNVCVDGNIADDDNGAGIAIYDGAYLVMNGGSLNNNILDGSSLFTGDISVCARGGGLYVNDATAVLNGVEIKNNLSKSTAQYGVAVCSEDSDVTLNACVINGNGLPDYGNEIYEPQSVIDAYGGKMTFKDCEITNNSNDYIPLIVGGFDINKGYFSRLINIDDATVYIDNTLIEDNKASVLLYAPDAMSAKVNLTVTNSKIINNQSTTLYLYDIVEGSYFEGCEFNNNIAAAKYIGDYDICLGSTVIFRDCDMGDSTYDNEGKKYSVFQNANGKVAGSIFGKGSLTVIVAVVALIASIASITVNVMEKKKKTVPATAAESDEESESDEE